MIELHGKDLRYSLDEREKYLYSIKEFPENYVLLRTCNRVELYSGDGSISSKITGHLFRVVSGLKSALIGETAIQGKELGCHAIKFDQFYQKLNTMDILFSTTSAPHLILKNEKFHVKHKMIIFDLAVPRDIDPEIEKLSNITLYNIEQIKNKIDQNLKKRQSEFKLAQRIVHEETQKFILKNQIKNFD